MKARDLSPGAYQNPRTGEMFLVTRATVVRRRFSRKRVVKLEVSTPAGMAFTLTCKGSLELHIRRLL